ncbi:hypothetical protein SAMN04490199_5389 [Pseudomonas marginalis]|jgi:hypothetical protein|nr:hypothetical protein BZ164_25305 [Pseudomonas veronii]SEC69487.1 hypothetical protein SAMN04490199_5389 [Pseudomonas marginalis]
MPVSPRPFTLVCACCSWKETILPHSHLAALSPDTCFCCPECRSPSLERREASRQEILRTRLDEFFILNK